MQLNKDAHHLVLVFIWLKKEIMCVCEKEDRVRALIPLLLYLVKRKCWSSEE